MVSRKRKNNRKTAYIRPIVSVIRTCRRQRRSDKEYNPAPRIAVNGKLAGKSQKSPGFQIEKIRFNPKIEARQSKTRTICFESRRLL